jgi:hypothetical protein
MRRAAALALLAPALAACGASKETGHVAPGTVTVGLILDARDDGEIAQGARKAVSEIDARGGIGGALEIRLTVRDSQREPKRAERFARELLAGGAGVLVLPCDVGSERAVVRAARGHHVLLLATCNYDPALIERTPGLWAVGVGANVEMAALADYLKGKGVDAVYVTPANDAEGWEPDITQLGHYFRAAARTRMIDVLPEPNPKTAIVVVRWPGFTAGFTQTYPTFTVVGTSLGQGRQTSRARDLVLTAYAYPSRSALGSAAIELFETAVARAGTAALPAVERELRGLEWKSPLGDVRYADEGSRNPQISVPLLHAHGGKVELLTRASPDEVPPP